MCKQRLIVIPFTKEAKAPKGSLALEADTSKTNDWDAYTTALHELVAPYTFPAEDQRDESYWEMVEPMFEETAHVVSSI